jgi:putative polyketide hydroxylase
MKLVKEYNYPASFWLSFFVLLSVPDGDPWLAAARIVAARLGLELDLYRAGTDFRDADNAFCAAYGISPRGAALARPAQAVRWRPLSASAQPEQALAEAFAQITRRA